MTAYNRHYGDTLDEIVNTKEEPRLLSQLENTIDGLSNAIQGLLVQLYPVLVPVADGPISMDESKLSSLFYEYDSYYSGDRPPRDDTTTEKSPLTEKSALLLKRLRLLILEVDSITIRVNIP